MVTSLKKTVIPFESPSSLAYSEQPTDNAQPILLPLTGMSRASQILPFLPFESSTLWKWSKEGKFITPVKLSPTITVWDNASVHIWLKNIAKGIDPVTATKLATAAQTDSQGV